MLAPIILFVYNRPEHTLKTLEALSKNALALNSVIYIYADAAKATATEADIANIAKVRQVIRQKKWCGEVNIVERETNMGLADNIVDGVTAAVKKYGKVIVLEDDIVTSPGFLQYMNDSLNVYADNEKVMHISGYMFPVKGELPETFFYNTASCWGWATWARAWKLYNGNAAELAQQISGDDRTRFNINNSYDFYGQLTDNISGKIKTWAVKWYSSIFLNGGYALHPYPSLVNNIGHDGGGENSGNSNVFNWKKLAPHIRVKPISLVQNQDAINKMVEFNQGLTKAYVQPVPLQQRLKAMIPVGIKHNLKNAYEKYLIRQIKQVPRFTLFKSKLVNNINLTGIDSSSFLFIYDEIFKTNIYYFKANTATPYILDCGANIGLGTIYFKQLYPKAQIIAFEPDPKIYDVLHQNVLAAGLKNVQLVKAALWKEDTVLSFSQEGADGGGLADNGDTVIKVQAEKLSKYIDKQVDFLKIDIEGAEVEVIKEIADKLHLVQNIFIEYHSYADKPQELEIILDTLRRTGFRYYVYNVSKLTTNPYLKINTSAGMDMQINICAIRTAQKQ